MTPWGFVVIAIVGMAAPFFIAPLVDRSHPAYTQLGLAFGFSLSLAFGTWRLVDTLYRLDSVDATTHGFALQAFLVAIGTLGTFAVSGLLLILGVVIGDLLGRWLNRSAT